MSMKELKEFTIPFVGLKIGEHRFDYTVKSPFFEHFEYDEFNDADVSVELLLVKKATLLEMELSFDGTVNVNCDLTNEPYDQPIEGAYRFVVKFGEENGNEDEDIIILPHGSHEVNFQQQLYESIVLAIPAKKVHPGVEDGSLQSDILKKLEELKPKSNDEKNSDDSDETDPRWDKLKNLLTDK